MQQKIDMLKYELIETQLSEALSLMEDLTESEYKVLSTIHKLKKKFGHFPMLIEVSEELNMTKQAVSQFVKKLIDKGYVQKQGRYAFSLTHKDAEIAVENVEKLKPLLEELKNLYDSGLITKEEYTLKKRKILNI